jgi:hypothetical protein
MEGNWTGPANNKIESLFNWGSGSLSENSEPEDSDDTAASTQAAYLIYQALQVGVEHNNKASFR